MRLCRVGVSRKSVLSSKKAKKRRHERYSVRAGRPVTQLINSFQQARSTALKLSLFPLTYLQMQLAVLKKHNYCTIFVLCNIYLQLLNLLRLPLFNLLTV